MGVNAMGGVRTQGDIFPPTQMNEQSPMCALLLNIASNRIAKYQRIEDTLQCMTMMFLHKVQEKGQGNLMCSTSNF